MKLSTKKLIKLFIPAILLFSFAVVLIADIDGRTGRTLKTSTAGCGGCHGSAATSDVIVTITAPDSVNPGQTVACGLTVAKPSKTGAGLDIATRRGTLSPISSNIRLSNGELTHNINIPMSGGTVTVQFNYIAPGTAGPDTIWATGLATNSNGSTSGDDWNWAPNKRVIVRNTTGVENNSTPIKFSLEQNYPNPFNPSTKIPFNLKKTSDITLKVYDILGNEVAVLVKGKMQEGSHEVEWDATGFPSSMYFYTLESESRKVTRKMLLVK